MNYIKVVVKRGIWSDLVGTAAHQCAPSTIRVNVVSQGQLGKVFRHGQEHIRIGIQFHLSREFIEDYRIAVPRTLIDAGRGRVRISLDWNDRVP
jgi:hypothetical protein